MTQINFEDIIPKDIADNNYGFIYKISVNGRKYVGQKSFNLGVSWKKYTSSNKIIKDLCKQYAYDLEILDIASSKRELTYLEVKHMFLNNVLENDEYENGNCLGKFFRGKLK
jgi:hypothetical protein